MNRYQQREFPLKAGFLPIHTGAFGTGTHTDGANDWPSARPCPGGITNTQIPVSGLPQGLYYLTIDGVTFKLLKN
ncbi:hypothetical protein [Puia dinghuensis]|uniref:Uncharacterized protein n=1 Tax=Puia dinghuensis TaxID=1792502 RepID=A0A8J2XWQ0_9BACT|nr:hypothetical protein [Puia dinghuensis]GGB25319.1 hypothetical protein GCM10011511_56610 [Puia dinghuensis]